MEIRFISLISFICLIGSGVDKVKYYFADMKKNSNFAVLFRAKTRESAA